MISAASVAGGVPYQFVTRWRVDAPIDNVWEALEAADRYPQWWPAVLRADQLEPGDDAGLGRVDLFVWKAPLGYRLRFTMRVDTIERPTHLGGVAGGELVGRGDWYLTAERNATQVRYDWGVRTQRAWMNLVAPVARPVFRHSHDQVMREGARGIARLLGVAVSLEERPLPP